MDPGNFEGVEWLGPDKKTLDIMASVTGMAIKKEPLLLQLDIRQGTPPKYEKHKLVSSSPWQRDMKRIDFNKIDFNKVDPSLREILNNAVTAAGAGGVAESDKVPPPTLLHQKAAGLHAPEL